MHKQLIRTRKLKGLSQSEMAAKVCMEQTTYSRKERGLSPISDAEWEKLAKSLEVDVEEIKDADAPNQGQIINPTIRDNGICIGVQYVNIPKDVLDALLNTNKFLQEELERARKGN